MLATSSPHPTGPEHREPVLTPLGLTAHGAHGRTADHPEGQAENSAGIHRAAGKTSASRLPTGSPLQDEQEGRAPGPRATTLQEKGGAGCTYYSRTASPVTLTRGTALGTECSRAHGPVQLPRGPLSRDGPRRRPAEEVRELRAGGERAALRPPRGTPSARTSSPAPTPLSSSSWSAHWARAAGPGAASPAAAAAAPPSSSGKWSCCRRQPCRGC